MSIEENKALLRHYLEEVDKGNLAVVDELVAANCVCHTANLPDLVGPEAVKQNATALLTAFPDLHRAIEDLVAEGDKVVVRGTATGTHQGEYFGIAATGKQVTMTVISICRVVGGKLVETWEVSDLLGALQQLGVIPTQ